MCGCLSHAPLPGTWPATQACALTGNRTRDPLVLRLVLSPLSHTSQGMAELSQGLGPATCCAATWVLDLIASEIHVRAE